MPSTRRSNLVYALLAAAWAIVLGWQAVEHGRVQKAARAELINRAKDISTTVGIVLRSQRRFGGVISKERIESALTGLVRPGELNGVALLNAAGDVVASAGTNVDLQPRSAVRPAELWENEAVTLVNLVDLGTNVTRDLEGTNPPIVLSREAFGRPGDTNRPPPDGRFGPPPPDREPDTNTIGMFAPPIPDPNHPPDHDQAGPRPQRGDTDGERRPRGGNDNDRRWRFGRPPWMSEVEFKSMIERQGVHSFLIMMSTQPVRSAMRQDFWLRGTIGALATLAVLGLGLAWGNLAKSSELQIRLVRASELNSHLRELNLAAAGLAHETRNPLNIVRGLAQMISKEETLPAEVRQKTRGIMDETDRVTAQLNEFINYSRPREVRRAAIALGTVVDEVVRALNCDVEEKKLRIETSGTQINIEADEQLLRQALFNLVLNAVQAVPPGGEIKVAAARNGPDAVLEVSDNGPGVPPERRTEIFKPYFTTNEKGTGLGLAVVQQIVLAHGWEITCLANEPRGARFRLTHLKLAPAKA
jgi:signal transduction histidine kinase